eukprot:m.72578 g.72578  ORF g.72578 m.72578 type:complete len:619 (+) comp24466_c0_seq1:91-1947(+)
MQFGVGTPVLARAWIHCRKITRVAWLFIALVGILSLVFLMRSPHSVHHKHTPTQDIAIRKMDKPLQINFDVEEEHLLERLDMAVAEAHDLVKATLPTPAQPIKSREELLAEQVQTKEEEAAERKAGFDRNRFEQYVSDRISLHRDNRDPRSHFCRELKFDITKLPTTSVVIVFHNEARSTLLRTVWSVLDRSPSQLIHEIILVDDASTYDHLGAALEAELKSIPKTKLVRLQERSGLIRAKVAGAKAATGDVLTFLDSHCECIDGWLEPLLDRIRQNRSNVEVPTIDSIDKTTFKYQGGSETTTRGVFSWTLTFTWLDLPYDEIQKRKDVTESLPTPTMAGGLFSIDRKYFWEVGSYDMGMEVWGGENLEMSFRIWQCGGRIEIQPCSRVGHVFRDRHPYEFPAGASQTINKNLNRVAEVWLDEFKDIYYELRPYHRNYGVGNITDRIELRNKLKCKSFKWYLDEVFPDMFVPIRENVAGRGALRNLESGTCLDAGSTKVEEMRPVLVDCKADATPTNTQEFYLWKKQSELRIETDFSARCLDSSKRDVHGELSFWGCHGMGGNQEFKYTEKLQIRHTQTGTCLTAFQNATKHWTPVSDVCDDNNRYQRWTFSKWHDF